MTGIPLIGALDPAIAQAIATIAGALSMLIISAASYYFPRGKDRFNHDNSDEDEDYEDDRPTRRRRKK